MPIAAASSHVTWIAFRPRAVHPSSGPPPLIDRMDGRQVVSGNTVVAPSRNPWSVLGAK